MNKELLVESHKRKTIEYKIINDILKGKEFTIPEEYAWPDKDGNMRKENRIKWWIDPINSTFKEFLFNCPKKIQHLMIDQKIDAIIYPKDAPSVFFGHYWMNDPYPVIQSGNIICLEIRKSVV